MVDDGDARAVREAPSRWSSTTVRASRLYSCSSDLRRGSVVVGRRADSWKKSTRNLRTTVTASLHFPRFSRLLSFPQRRIAAPFSVYSNIQSCLRTHAIMEVRTRSTHRQRLPRRAASLLSRDRKTAARVLCFTPRSSLIRPSAVLPGLRCLRPQFFPRVSSSSSRHNLDPTLSTPASLCSQNSLDYDGRHPRGAPPAALKPDRGGIRVGPPRARSGGVGGASSAPPHRVMLSDFECSWCSRTDGRMTPGAWSYPTLRCSSQRTSSFTSSTARRTHETLIARSTVPLSIGSTLWAFRPSWGG